MTIIFILVRKGGFEPPRLAAPPPQDGVSASSTTSALRCKSVKRQVDYNKVILRPSVECRRMAAALCKSQKTPKGYAAKGEKRHALLANLGLLAGAVAGLIFLRGRRSILPLAALPWIAILLVFRSKGGWTPSPFSITARCAWVYTVNLCR